MQNITDLRKSLADNYTKMKAGKMGLNTGKELSNCAGKILNSIKVELEYNHMLGIKEKIEFMEEHEEPEVLRQSPTQIKKTDIKNK